MVPFYRRQYHRIYLQWTFFKSPGKYYFSKQKCEYERITSEYSTQV